MGRLFSLTWDPAVPPTLSGATSSLSSDNASVVGAFGLGMQSAFWFTSDGVRHIIYNRGTLNGSGNSLQLAKSTDGVTWTNVLTLPSSGPASNADVVLSSSTSYWCAYGDNTGGVSVVRLAYSGGTWTIGTGPETIPLAGGVTGRNPSIAIDGNNSIWVGLLASDVTGDYLIAFRRTGVATYVDSTNVFGSADISPAPQRSIRLVQVPGGLFAIYTEHGTLNYRRRNNTDGTTAAWGSVVNLYNDPLQLGTFQSEFSVAIDANRNLHVAYSGSGRLLYFRWDAAGTSWSNQFVTVACGSAMPQAVVSDGGRVWLLTQDQYTNVLGYLSVDSGTTFLLAATYGHATVTSSVTYANPRPRALPPVGSLFPPILLEYTDTGVEKALAY